MLSVGLAMVISLAGAFASEKMLVSAEDLLSLDQVLLVDVRSRSMFEQGHIPNAVNVDMAVHENSAGTTLVAALTPVLEQAGVAPERHVVIYGFSGTLNDLQLATRLFWALDYLGYPQLSILNGGYEKWTFDGHAVESGAATPQPVSLASLRPITDRLAPLRHVAQTLQDQTGVVADVRDTEVYTGAALDPAGARQGHIPNAKNVPAKSFVEGPFNTFKPVYDLENILVERGVESNTHVIAVGSTGLNGSIGYFVFRMTGRMAPTLFDGAMQEWSADSQMPVSNEASHQ